MKRRPILIGENNPYSLRPEAALFPAPERCTGWNIWKMINERCGATRTEYANAFDRRNLVMGKWDDKAAAREAKRIMRDAPKGSTIVLLGEKVRAAFGIEKRLLHPVVEGGVSYRQIPHPSGMNRFYNDQVQRTLVAILLEDLYNQGREA